MATDQLGGFRQAPASAPSCLIRNAPKFTFKSLCGGPRSGVFERCEGLEDGDLRSAIVGLL